MDSRRGWKMVRGFPTCTCTSKHEQGRGTATVGENADAAMARACNHLYVRKSTSRRLFHISTDEATCAGSPIDSTGGVGEELVEKSQGVRVLRGGPLIIVIHPIAATKDDDDNNNNDKSKPLAETVQAAPSFASLADERAADDMGVLLMGGVSRALSPAASRHKLLHYSSGTSGRSCLLRCSRSSPVVNRGRKQALPQSVTLKMPSGAFEVDIKLEKVLKKLKAQSPLQQTYRTNIVRALDLTGYREKAHWIRCYKHTISSLISSRITDMDKESKLLQEWTCRAHQPNCPSSTSADKSSKKRGSMRRLYGTYSKHTKRQLRQFNFH